MSLWGDYKKNEAIKILETILFDKIINEMPAYRYNRLCKINIRANKKRG